MTEQRYTIPSLKVPFFFFIVFFAILVPVIGLLLRSVVGLPGIIFLFLLWVLTLLPIWLYIKSKGERVELSNAGIIIYQRGTTVLLGWNDIDKIGFQALASRRMGIYEVYPYLAISLVSLSKKKIEPLVSSKEYGFFQKTGDLVQYMGKTEKFDIYINVKFLKEHEKGMLDYLSKKQQFVKSIAPLVKTSQQEEYDKVIAQYFQSTG